MKTQKLKNGLICVSVPKDATNIFLYNKNTLRWQEGIVPTYHMLEKVNYDYEIFGTITKDETTIDSKVLSSYDVNYEPNTSVFSRFKSMIESETEFLFENPKSHPSEIEPTNRNHYDQITEQWQQAQDRVVEKLLILKPIQ